MTERTGVEANARLLRLLVGSNLYPTPDVCVRELLQNAWDAIELRRASGDGSGGSIAVRFSAAERWFEVEDDGIGMSRDDVKASFSSVGSDKLEVLGAEGQAGEQVAFFGIGVLSVFLVASRAELVTRKASEAQGLRVDIEGLGENDVEMEGVERNTVGTAVRVWIGSETPFDPSSVPEAVRKYARHVPGIIVEDVDSGSGSDLDEIWDTEGLLGTFLAPEQERIREGRLGFVKTLTDEAPVVSNTITLCNGGFLVEAGATDLLPINPLGFGGEIDLHANALNVVMARERFQQDDKWAALGQELLGVFEERALKALDSGFLANSGGFDPPEVRRCLLLWYWALREISLLDGLKTAVRERVLSTVPFQVAGSDRRTSIDDALDGLPEPRLYYRRVGGHTIETSPRCVGRMGRRRRSAPRQVPFRHTGATRRPFGRAPRAAILAGMKLDVRRVTTEEDLDSFSGVLLDVAGWLEAGGHPLWTAEELAPAALLRSYDLREMRLGLLSGEPVAAMVVQERDELFWPDVPEGESLFVHKLAAVRRLKGRGVAAAMLDRARAAASGQGRTSLRLDCAADRPKLCRFYEDFGFRRVGRRMMGHYDAAFYELLLR